MEWAVLLLAVILALVLLVCVWGLVRDSGSGDGGEPVTPEPDPRPLYVPDEWVSEGAR